MSAVGSILVLSQQPVLAALVGMLVELAGRAPVFPTADEPPSDAIRRLSPLAVILIDAEADAARSDMFFAVAARSQIGVVVFGSEREARRVAEVAASRRIPWITLPPEVDRLRHAIRFAAERGRPRERAPRERTPRQAERRQVPDAVRAPDGTNIFRDGFGRHWMIFDRRAARDRRADGDRETADLVFVAEDGETRHCIIATSDLEHASARDLEAQLGRSEA